MNLTTYKVSYNDRDFAPDTRESVEGYAASDRRFPKSRWPPTPSTCSRITTCATPPT